MASVPDLDRWDASAAVGVVALLVVAYVLVPTPTVQYVAWLAVFCIWMAWFVFFGVKWLYRAE
ncbi:hypothetical protein VB773_16425 [Haloarculaceae archaeon H-GB2-1]|nr:hypothetical protein [Haloarculaceae archaeon H-GB1-1]MEA5387515.1 hypothetical protein [Haloarculaceae archaeon H-GB11]MEA5408997.1 hypothetical protein [Haloarculaceae archaeon H-GB2-1]